MCVLYKHFREIKVQFFINPLYSISFVAHKILSFVLMYILKITSQSREFIERATS